ncbi:telomerase Cajal body protein 1 isoform X2 [Leptopilina heterotoma]|uniref:telomerase Cajal body protein 1 isoform X2 n=1 Tax=Leptopilina heterotoma TaxID=63436 RepID=UPI001CA91064|nr:telomerase Cajal body protein 1 isoform X2 [Leptopilina heterotoma]
MEMNEVETIVSIVTAEDENISDYIDSPNSLDEFKKPASNTVKDFLMLLNSEEVKINVELTLEDKNNECNNKSLKNEQQSEILVTETCKNEDEDRFTENEEKNQENMMDVDTNNILENETKSASKSLEGETQSLNFEYNWTVSQQLLCSATEEYKASENCENFTKGCQWSPDGTCLMVPSEDFRIRIYELPKELYSEKPTTNLSSSTLKSALCVKEGGLIYDSCWYPHMNSWNPATCCFLSTSQETPIHLWDAFTGELRATYRAYNQVDEVEPAISIRFINSGAEVWSGFKGALRKFDTERPGRQTEDIFLKHDFPTISGLVSCIRENPIMPGLVAFGTYSKYIGLYQNGPVCCFKTNSGVTQLEFSPCGTKLYSAVRRSNEFYCWDLRNPGVVLWSMENREANTNQKINFDISKDGSTIVSGGVDGVVKVWKVDVVKATEEEAEELNPISRISLSKDCINGVSLHGSLPLLATSSGQRICDEREQYRDNSVRLWWFGNNQRT